jgi:hypothetical protein
MWNGTRVLRLQRPAIDSLKAYAVGQNDARAIHGGGIIVAGAIAGHLKKCPLARTQGLQGS